MINTMGKVKDLALRAAAVFYKDIHWKLLALGLAFIVWLVGVNVNNPVELVSYGNIPLNIIGRDQITQNNLVLLNDQQLTNSPISVSVRATRSNHALINAARAERIQASIDLGTINFEQVFEADDIVRIPMDVNVFIHENYVTRLPAPSTVELVLDRHEDRLLPINVDVFGNPAEGFENQTYTHSPRVVRLFGARSVLDQVADVWVRVYINDASYTVEEPRPLVVYSSDRQDITDRVNLSVQSTNVIVPIYPYADVPLGVSTVGSAMPGFMATEIIIDPPIISVLGDAETIADLNTIMLGSVDVTMANQSFEYPFDIRRALTGTGLSLRSGVPSEATVSVVIERVISRNFQLPLENLSVSGYVRPYTIETEGPLTLTLRGRESVINTLNLSQIGASADLTGLGAGTHRVQVNVVTPPRASLENLVTVDITIEPEPIVFEPEDPADWTADLDEDTGYYDEDIEDEEP